MAELTYLDFDLLIERSGSDYRARVLNSPAGQASRAFSPPFAETELETLLAHLGRSRSAEARDARRRQGSATDTSDAAKQFGRRLFEAVFGDEVLGCLRRSLDAAERQGVGLRVRLRLADVPELAGWPWEYLYDAAFNHFLALSVQTPIVRYLELPQPVEQLQVEPPLRILVVISSPEDYVQLDVDEEWRKLSGALGTLQEAGQVSLKRLEEATLPDLQSELRRGEYHIFHFIGHGDFDEQAQAGALLFEDAAERGRFASGERLGTLLHDHGSLRLAVLNGCKGARAPRHDAFAGTAQALVQQGVPAVIAMQFAISDAAAITFSREFYSAVADHYPVDAALGEARKAMQDYGTEWGTPALFMRAPDGVIWQMAAEEEQMGEETTKPWWEDVPAHVGGDVIIAEVGAGTSGVAIGKNITQTIYNVLGEPKPDDKQVIEQQLAAVTAKLHDLQGQLDAGTVSMAEFQLELLESELTKIEEDAVPSASTITRVGDWLLDNVPAIAEALTSLFATPAVGKVVGKAGEAAVAWVKKRFGSDR